MVDYDKSTGSSGTMRIRDLGNQVEFWINSGSSSTWTDHLPWGYTVNGSTGTSTYNYPSGAGWRRLGFWSVTTSQNVTFRLFNSGTSGFGGPTTHTVFINRATVPPAPNAPVLTDIQEDQMHAAFTDNGNGGSVIFIWQIGYSTSSSGPTSFVNTNSADITGLSPGTTYYFWGRGQNAQGFGPWSVRSQATTLSVPAPPSSPVISDITQVSVVATFTPNSDGGTAITGYEVGWSTSNTLPPASTSAGSSPKTVTGLTPGTTYYFWVRAQNAVGWSDWSVVATAMTIPGVRINVEGVWKSATPYVRDGGVWKVARPWGKIAGVWKETS